MLDVNEYFNGQVKSIAFPTRTLPATVGVMSEGAYTFGTDCKEIMTVVSGELKVRFPKTNEWHTYIEGQVFEIEADKKFDVEAIVDTAYLCQYIR